MKEGKQRPILAICNGHVSGQEVGSTLDVLGTGLTLDEDAYTAGLVSKEWL